MYLCEEGKFFSSCLPPLVRNMHCYGRLQKIFANLLGESDSDPPHVDFYIPFICFSASVFVPAPANMQEEKACSGGENTIGSS